MMLLSESDISGTLIWFVVFFVFIMFYPRLTLSQIIWKIEAGARRLEAMSERANSMVASKIGERSVKKSVDQFTEFFVIEPSALDPYGIVRKLDQVIRQTEHRFEDFVSTVASKKSVKERQQINYGLRAALGVRQLAKIVRHYVETAKKYKNLQIAMIIQMQMPMIEKIAEGEFKGTQAFLHSWAVGDSIGPLIAAELVDKVKPIAEDMVMGQTTIEGRRCFVIRASGPDPHLGRVDEAIEKIMAHHNIERVVTIDAAQKLEGERSGGVAEGVGFAMGGVAQRDVIENALLPKKKPIDSIVVKVGMEEAIIPMKKEVLESTPVAIEAVKRAVRRAKPGSSVLIIGVGNSVGIPNERKHLPKYKEEILRIAAKVEQREAKQQKGGWF